IARPRMLDAVEGAGFRASLSRLEGPRRLAGTVDNSDAEGDPPVPQPEVGCVEVPRPQVFARDPLGARRQAAEVGELEVQMRPQLRLALEVVGDRHPGLLPGTAGRESLVGTVAGR